MFKLIHLIEIKCVFLSLHCVCVLVSPWAESHQWDGGAGEEDSDQQEGTPPPHVRQRANQRGRHERQQALDNRKRWF